MPDASTTGTGGNDPLDEMAYTVSKLSLQPGDVLVFHTPHRVPAEGVERFQAHFQRIFPETRVILLEGGTELSVLHFENSRADKLAVTMTITESLRDKPIHASSTLPRRG